MISKITQEVLDAFVRYGPTHTIPDLHTVNIDVVGGGLINKSFKVSSPAKPDILLQCINKHVFANPAQVQENYINIWEYAEFEFTGLRLPSPKHCSQMSTLYVDEAENYWRAFEYIDGATMHRVATTPSKAKATAVAFGKFTATFDDFDIDSLRTVIPGFHDLLLRYKQFEDSLHTEWYERMAIAMPLINALKERQHYCYFFELIAESGKFPQRVTHHDAKITNVLFSKDTGRVLCLVDFDTVMPGYFFSDLGDLVRSIVSPEDENSLRFDKIRVRKNYYDAIIAGYLQVLRNQLTASEHRYLHYAGPLMVYMQTLRFLTDYLNGDPYYQTEYAQQNFDRANNQFILLQHLEVFLKENYNFRND